MATNDESTTRFRVDISELKRAFQEAQRQVRMANSEFQAATAGMDRWGDSADGLSAKINQLTSVLNAERMKLENLERQYELTVQQMGEGSRAAEDLRIRLNNQIAVVRRTERDLAHYESRLEEIANTANQSVSAYDRLTNEISQQETELRGLQRQYANYVVEGREASDEARELAARISQLSGDINANRTALSNADSAADGFAASMDDIGDAADDAGDATQTLSDGFTIVKGALADLVADGIRAAVDALKELVVESDKAFNSFQAQTGTSAAEMEKFEDEITSLYKSNFGENMEDVAESMAKVAQTSKETDPSKIKELTKNALILRDTFGYEIDETMRAANMLMDQFGITGEEAFNLIAQGTQNGLNKNGDLLDSINEYSVHYKQMGYDAEDFFNSLSNGTEAGTFSVDKLGDAMKEFGIRLREGGDEVNDVLGSMGLVISGVSEEQLKAYQKNVASLDKINEKIANGGTEAQLAGWNKEKKILEEKIKAHENEVAIRGELNEKIKAQYGDLYARIGEGGEEGKAAVNDILTALSAIEDPIEQNAAGVALFGSMWEDLGAEGVTALMNVSGEADRTAATMDEINAVKYDDIGSAFSEIGRIIKVDLLQPIADALMPTITEFIDWLKSDAIPWLMENGNNLIALVTSIGAAFLAFKAVTIIQGIITAFSTLIPIIKSVGLAQAALNVIMNANPIGLIVAAIAALVAGFIYLWNTSDEFRAFWIGLWENIKSTVSTVIDSIVQFFTNLWTGITEKALAAGEFMKTIWFAISEFFADLWLGISTAAGNAWTAIKEFFAPATEWFTELFTSVKNSFDSVINVIIGLAKGCWLIIQRVFEVVGDWFKTNVIDPVSKFFTEMWTKISKAGKSAWTSISGVFKSAATWFKNTLITPISGFFSNMWDKLKSGASDAWDGIKSVFSVVTDWFRDKFSEAWTAVKDVFSAGGKIFDGIKDGIVSAFKTVVNAIIRGINKVVSIPFNAINGLLNKIRNTDVLGIKPFEGLWNENPLSVPEIPLLAKGGVVNGATLAMIGEDGQEAVVPLERNTKWIDLVANKIVSQIGSNGFSNGVNSMNQQVYNNFYQTNNSPKALSRLEIYRQTKNQIAMLKGV